MKSFTAMMVGLVAMGAAVQVGAEVYHDCDFNAASQGWSAATAQYMQNHGWDWQIWGVNQSEVRSDNFCPADDGTPPPITALRSGNRAHWRLVSDTSASKTGGAENETVSFWLNVLDDFRSSGGGGLFQTIGDWDDGDSKGYCGAGVRLYVEDAGVNIVDAAGDNPQAWFPEVGHDVWYKVTTNFEVPDKTYSMVITDESGATVLSHSGTVFENGHTLSEVDGFTCDLYGNHPAHSNWWDNFEFESRFIPEPGTVVLLNLVGAVMLLRRR